MITWSTWGVVSTPTGRLGSGLVPGGNTARRVEGDAPARPEPASRVAASPAAATPALWRNRRLDIPPCWPIPTPAPVRGPPPLRPGPRAAGHRRRRPRALRDVPAGRDRPGQPHRALPAVAEPARRREDGRAPLHDALGGGHPPAPGRRRRRHRDRRDA